MTGRRLVLGVDPGLSGGLALCCGASVVDAIRLPLVSRGGKDWPDLPSLVAWVGRVRLVHGCCASVVEDVGAMPGQGVVSMFRFGLVTGMVRGVLAASGFSVVLVKPAAWKAKLGLSRDKDACRSEATRYFGTDKWWPKKSDDGVAEAALMTRVVLR